MAVGKHYLHKREFVSKNKDDRTIVDSVVRRYDFGGYDARFSLSTPASAFHNGGVEITCNPDSEESLADADQKINDIVAALKEFQKAINDAAKDARKKTSARANR